MYWLFYKGTLVDVDRFPPTLGYGNEGDYRIEYRPHHAV